MRDLKEMEDRAQRRLDGTKVNVDAMAQDVLDLVRSVRSLQSALRTAQQEQVVIRPPEGAGLDKGFADSMRDVFGGGGGFQRG